MRSEDEDADGLSSSDLGSWSEKSSDEVENDYFGVQEVGSEVLEVSMPDYSLISQSEGS